MKLYNLQIVQYTFIEPRVTYNKESIIIQLIDSTLGSDCVNRSFQVKSSNNHATIFLSIDNDKTNTHVQSIYCIIFGFRSSWLFSKNKYFPSGADRF